MRKLLSDADVKSLLVGAAGVAAIGVLCGAAMQPNLRGPSDTEGPQMQAGVSGVRTAWGYDATASYTSYQNGLPDYVVGTDWLKPPEYPGEELPEVDSADEASSYVSAYDATAYEPVAVATYDEPPRAPTRYPSVDGGAAHAAEATASAAVALEPVETSLDPELAEMAAATPG